jgi:hypothetical protein
MDPVSVGASAIAFIGIALKSTNFIFNVILAISDFPNEARQLTRDLQHLHGILEGIARCRAVEEDGEFLCLLRECSNDVTAYARRVQKLEIVPGERRPAKVWKKFKSLFGEADLELMRHAVRGHILSLSSRLSLLQV